MEQSFDYTPIFQITPLAILLLIVFVFVFRGLRSKPDDTNNRASGGGPGDAGGTSGLD